MKIMKKLSKFDSLSSIDQVSIWHDKMRSSPVFSRYANGFSPYAILLLARHVILNPSFALTKSVKLHIWNKSSISGERAKKDRAFWTFADRCLDRFLRYAKL